MRFFNTKPVWTYNPQASYDGTGAQMQRIMGVYAMCKFFRVPYLHSPIQQMIITPLDPHQDATKLAEYLKRLDAFLGYSSQVDEGLVSQSCNIDSISLSKALLHSTLNRFCVGKPKVFRITNISRVLEYFPDIYRLAVPERRIDGGRIYSEVKKIAVHFRRGSNSKDRLKGESSPRAVASDWYVKVTQKYFDFFSEQGKDVHIDVYTDMPKSSFVFTPPNFQIKMWRDEPRIKDGQILVEGEDLEKSVFRSFRSQVTIKYGGDPLEDLDEMSKADVLIMSRSSFSFVAGLMNRHGTVICPPNFWHRNLTNWVLEK